MLEGVREIRSEHEGGAEEGGGGAGAREDSRSVRDAGAVDSV